ncbi:Single Cache domain 2-containing protein [Duganella sp. CF517]|uniref:cache domain-containing protein n=1 Tax=Duganella sp. CF517 TaxID=1881038 RepID=UPI0008C05D88|nr:cache domain-containing protein [Duganella sp. CF517]SEO06232.1 Single Cache domain 2-containing protein [Duganella sp. CF517]
MKRFLQTVVMMAAFAVGSAGAADAERASAKDAVAMVKKVIADMKKLGKDKVIQDIQAQSPQYRDRDLYVSVGTLEGMSLANGNNAKMAGKNIIDLKDLDGKLITRERIEIAKTKGSGWQDYKWPDPVTKAVQKKSMYVERHEDMTVACGIYKD